MYCRYTEILKYSLLLTLNCVNLKKQSDITTGEATIKRLCVEFFCEMKCTLRGIVMKSLKFKISLERSKILNKYFLTFYLHYTDHKSHFSYESAFPYIICNH